MLCKKKNLKELKLQIELGFGSLASLQLEYCKVDFFRMAN
jgi:hypothetical protein